MFQNPIIPALEEFLNIPYKDLALLIYGPWGCGKTYFLRHFLGKEWQNKNVVYCSLSGHALVGSWAHLEGAKCFIHTPLFDPTFK